MTTIGHGPNAPALLSSAVMISSFPKSGLAIPAQIDVAENPAYGPHSAAPIFRSAS